MSHQDVVEAKVQAKQLEISKQELNEQIKNQILEIQKITGLDLRIFDQAIIFKVAMMVNKYLRSSAMKI